MKALAIVFLGLVLSGCATTSVKLEEREYRNTTRLIEAQEEFLVRERRCNQFGGIMNVKRIYASLVHRAYTWEEYDRAVCVR